MRLYQTLTVEHEYARLKQNDTQNTGSITLVARTNHNDRDIKTNEKTNSNKKWENAQKKPKAVAQKQRQPYAIDRFV